MGNRTWRLVLASILLVDCGQSERNSFLGGWYNCDYVGQYTELHIEKNKFIINWARVANPSEPHFYFLQNDTLLSYDTLHGWKDESGHVKVIKHTFFLKDDSLIWLSDYSRSLTNRIPFSKIELDENLYQESDSIDFYPWQQQQFRIRENQINCQDLRSEEERTRDSLELKRNSIRESDFL